MISIKLFSASVTGDDPDFYLDLPAGARVLSVITLPAMETRWTLGIYAECRDGCMAKKRRFRAYQTGVLMDLPVNARFVGMVSFSHGAMVLHVYDLGEV